MLWRHQQFHCDFTNDVIMTSHIYEMTSWRKTSPCHILNETTMKFFTEFHLGHVKAPNHVVQCDTLCRWFIINELSIFERTVNNWEMEVFQFTWMTCLFIVFSLKHLIDNDKKDKLESSGLFIFICKQLLIIL